MKRKLRSSVPCSAEELLSSAESEVLSKSGRSKIRSLIWSFGPSYGIVSSLPSALHVHVDQSLDSLKQYLKSGKTESVASGAGDRSSCSPPFKSFKNSSRLKRSDDHEDEATLPEPGSETLNVLKKLRAYAYITHLCVSHPKIASLCEKWWKEDFPGREIVISQSLPYLLSKSLAEGKKTDVHRVYTLREAFTLFDYEDDSIEDLRLLIVRCVISPVYLKTKEGRGFIAFILGLNRQLLKEALVLIRSQIPFGKKSVLEGYAEILFKAWRGSVDFTKEEIENGFLQGLVEGAIFAQNKQLASSIRRVLSGFVCQRATSGVDKLLFHLAEPLLFRSLQVANSNVRHNALFLFLDLFPIEDPDVTKEEKDILLEKQYFLLQKLLMDECPEVVSLDSLFSSLADDHERVARKLTRLLIPSYLPSKVTPKEACNRFFTLMRRAPVAGARFCEFALSEGSSLKTLMELLRFSLGLVLTGSGLSSGQIDGLITASANICSTTSVQARIAVLGIASMVSPDDLGELHDRCIIFVIECTDLSDDQERKGLLSAVHRLMLDCGWFDELVEILTCILKTIATSILAKFSADVPHQAIVTTVIQRCSGSAYGSQKRSRRRRNPRSTPPRMRANHVGSSLSLLPSALVLPSSLRWRRWFRRFRLSQKGRIKPLKPVLNL
ncbi:hypothetical protein HPP92_028383 [Vanilla planifolia]|uniref:Uncharacterized protein n=1 Tax=Vanilla planifolia TaxID=51239 RepID=A0A835U2N1_VANPL|nr:hypothetical protein HPP92_028383 [Vanilla planifolia]